MAAKQIIKPIVVAEPVEATIRLFPTAGLFKPLVATRWWATGSTTASYSRDCSIAKPLMSTY